MEELIKRLERVIQTGALDKDGLHPIAAEVVLEVVKELTEHGTNLAEVGIDTISRRTVKEKSMTKEEIIHRLQYARHRIDNVTYAPDVLKAIDIAIEAVGNTDADTISRQAAIDTFKECAENGVGIDEIVDALESLPSAQPERIKGRWIYTGVKFPNWEGQVVSEAICSECNGISYFRRAFDKYIGANICPNCGADMRGANK